MRLTVYVAIRGRRLAWMLDSGVPTLRPARRGPPQRISQKSSALLLLLAARRGTPSDDPSLGWVELSELAAMAAWRGMRTSASLAAQVRREIKALHGICPGLIETPPRSRLKGPLRLALPPSTTTVVKRLLKPLQRTRPHTFESLYDWMEGAELAWRSSHYFDKRGEALSSFSRVDDVAARDPLVRSLAGIAAARRLRELGAYERASSVLDAATLAARAEVDLPLRRHLDAQCCLQRAWLSYRTGDIDATERWLAMVDGASTSGASLSLRGQMLSLRSLVRRSQGRWDAALDDLSQAARLFVVDGDLFHLFAVYHNLATLITVRADTEPDAMRRRAALRQALNYSRRNEAYCHRYGIGQNSVLNKLLQVGLQRELGHLDAALGLATKAEGLALESENIPDALKAHGHRLGILLMRGQITSARDAHQATLATLPGQGLKREFSRVYKAELRRHVEAPHAYRSG